jgi:hypothetical protein
MSVTGASCLRIIRISGARRVQIAQNGDATMIFFSDKVEKNGPKLEAKLRKELRQTQPLQYQTEVHGTRNPSSIGRFLGDLVGDLSLELLGSAGLRPVYTLRFEVPNTSTEVRVNVVTDGKMVMLGAILYSAVLKKPVAGAVRLQEESEKAFFNCKFDGEPQTAAKLNASKPLIKRVNGFVRDSYMLGQTQITAKRFFRLESFEQGSLLNISTVPRSKWFGLASTFDAPEFFQIAQTIESLL